MLKIIYCLSLILLVINISRTKEVTRELIQEKLPENFQCELCDKCDSSCEDECSNCSWCSVLNFFSLAPADCDKFCSDGYDGCMRICANAESDCKYCKYC